MATVSTENQTDVFDIVAWETAANYFNAWAAVPIIIFGLCGNIFTIYVFSRQTNWERGMLHYFFFLAISDAGCLIIYGGVEWVSEGLKFATQGEIYFDLINHSTAACKTFRYVWNVFGSTSSWLIVCVTAERYATIANPLRREYFNGRLRKKIIITTYIFWILYHIPASAVSYDVRPLHPNSTDLLCTFQEPNYTGRMFFAYAKLVMMYAMPVLIVSCLNSLIIFTLCRGRKEREEILAKTSNFETRASRTLFIISTVFLITIIPPSVSWLTYFHLFMVRTDPLSPYDRNVQKLVFSIGKFANTISMINYSINCIVYCCQFQFYKSALKAFCHIDQFRRTMRTVRKQRVRIVSISSTITQTKMSASSV